MELSDYLKKKIAKALLEARKNFTGSDESFAIQWGVEPDIYDAIKNNEPKFGLMRDDRWVLLAKDLGVTPEGHKWNVARTEVFTQIEEEILFCKKNANSMIFVDDCEIGKSFTAKYLSRTVENCFYVDCSQSKYRKDLIKAIGRKIGVASHGSINEIKTRIKAHLLLLPKPIIILDEFGDLTNEAFLELKEFWNAAEGYCAWYMMGADGARAKLDRGIKSQRVGFREIFSRYSNKYQSIVPADKAEKESFYRKLITTVLSANCTDKQKVATLVKKCLASALAGETSGLRRAEALLILSNQN